MWLCFDFSYQICIIKDCKFGVKRNPFPVSLCSTPGPNPHINHAKCSSEFTVGNCVVAKFLCFATSLVDFIIYDFIVFFLWNSSLFYLFFASLMPAAFKTAYKSYLNGVFNVLHLSCLLVILLSTASNTSAYALYNTYNIRLVIVLIYGYFLSLQYMQAHILKA